MVNRTLLTINQLTYAIPNEKVIFDRLSMTLAQEKVGLVGSNGVGKTTLLKLISREYLPDSGSIQLHGVVGDVPQQTQHLMQSSVAAVLGVADKLQALQRIADGSVAEADFACVGEDWDLRERVMQQLLQLGLVDIALDGVMSVLSGGQQTRLLLAKVFLQKPDLVLLDEPTNNLDTSAREAFYQTVAQWRGGMIVVSHDRQLLNQMDKIIELNAFGATVYGGNYDFYVAEKETHQCAAEQALQVSRQLLNKGQGQVQKRKEVHQRAASKGIKAKKDQIKGTGSYDKIAFNAAKGRSEKTNKRIGVQADRKLKDLNAVVKTAQSKVEVSYQLALDLSHTAVPNNKIVLDVCNLSFKYKVQKKMMIDQLNFKMVGPQHIALRGNNGSGKTTFLKLILGQLQPASGTINIGVDQVAYMDQHASQLDPALSILDNFGLFNPDMTETDTRRILAHFLFRNKDALKLVGCLSGGEKLRVLLACVLMSKIPPQLLILDEPTNHLDLQSLASIESALKGYQGAMLIISHDQAFLESLGVDAVLDF